MFCKLWALAFLASPDIRKLLAWACMDSLGDAAWHQALGDNAGLYTQVALLQDIVRSHSCAYEDDEVKPHMRQGKKVWHERRLLEQECAPCDV